MTPQFIAIDPDRLAAVEAKLDLLLARTERATITPAPRWVTVAEYADIRDCSDATVRRWIKNGVVEARGAGRRREVRVE